MNNPWAKKITKCTILHSDSIRHSDPWCPVIYFPICRNSIYSVKCPKRCTGGFLFLFNTYFRNLFFKSEAKYLSTLKCSKNRIVEHFMPNKKWHFFISLTEKAPRRHVKNTTCSLGSFLTWCGNIGNKKVGRK